jgi:hypothetical protein
MPSPLKPREQGDLGELSAMEWLAGLGARIAVPIFSSPDWDLVAEQNGALLRVQVKTSTQSRGADRWSVVISTRGGNRSWSGLVKYFDPARCDYLFVHVGDGRRWFIPSEELDCRSGLTLGGSKYAEFEVERGRPLLHPTASRIELPSRGSAGAGEPGRTVNPVATPEWVRIPPPPLSRPVIGRTRISANHQLTIPTAPFRAAELQVGDHVRVKAEGEGRVTLSRIELRSDTSRFQGQEQSDGAE